MAALVREARTLIAKRQSAVRPRIDASAFIAIMFALLFLFIGQIASYPDLPHGFSADLPQTAHAIEMSRANREDAIMVGVTRDGKIYFGSDQISANQLPQRIRSAVNHGSEHRVYIRADKRTKYGNVTEVVDEIHLAGIQKISFLTERPIPADSAQ